MLRLLWLVQLHTDQAQAIQCVHLDRVQKQDFQPDFRRALRVVMQLPVMPLLDEQCLWRRALSVGNSGRPRAHGDDG